MARVVFSWKSGLWPAVCCLLGLSWAGWASDTTGTVQGYVMDSSRASVPGVLVELTNEATNVSVTQRTGPEGNYVFNLVPPGVYTLRAKAEGFRMSVARGIVVELNKNTRADLALELGEVATSVEVLSSAVGIDTVSAQVSTNVERKYVTELPSAFRSSLSFAMLAPGVQLTNVDAQVTNIEGPQATVNGNRVRQNVFYLDGSDNTAPFRNSALQMPNPEAVQEVSVSTSNTSAEFGKQPGGTFNIVTKSGTNQFHGAGFYFFHNENLNANSWSRNKAGSARATDRVKQLGGALGGPLQRNKTFFFTSYNAYRDKAPGFQSTVRFPTGAMVQGDFSQFNRPLYDPDTRAPLPGNIIPKHLIDPVAANLVQLIPTVANYGDRLVWAYEGLTRNNELLAKIDHNFSTAHTLQLSYFGTWGERVVPAQAGNNVPAFGPEIDTNRQHTGSARHIWTARSNLVVQTRFGIARHAADRGQSQLGRNLEDFGAKWPPIAPEARKYLPHLSVSDGFMTHQGNVSLFDQHNYRISSTAIWTRGRHSLKFGAESQRDGVLQWADRDFASFTFDGRFASTDAAGKPTGLGVFGYSMADFMMGRTATFFATGLRDYDLADWSHFFFVEDQWKVTPRLTVTPGLRYELYIPVTEKQNRISAFIPNHQSDRYPNAPLHLAFPEDTGVPAGFFEQDRNNFAPRLGLAYDIAGNGKTVIRSGFGYFYAYNSFNIKLMLAESPPWQPRAEGGEARLSDPWGTSRTVVYPQPPTPFSKDASTFNYPPRLSGVYGFDPGYRTPYTVQWNVTFERQVTDGVSVQAAYVANRGFKLVQWVPTNLPLWQDNAGLGNIEARRPLARYGRINEYHSRSRSWFDSFQLSADVRLRRGLTSRFTYVLGKNQQITSWDTDICANPTNLDGEKAEVSARHLLRAFYVYELPWLERNQNLLGRLFGRWQVSGTFTASSGSPLNVTLGEDWNYDGIAGDRPDRAGSIQYTSGSKDQKMLGYFDKSAFAQPAIRNIFGNLPRNALWGPAFWDTTFALLKNFQISEGMSFQLRAEAYNLFNHNNLSSPVTNMRSADFTRILTRTGERTMQIGLRFRF